MIVIVIAIIFCGGYTVIGITIAITKTGAQAILELNDNHSRALNRKCEQTFRQYSFLLVLEKSFTV